MQINLTIFGSGPTIVNNKLRYKAAQADSPTAIVASLTEDPPHSFPHAVTLNVPNPVPHIVQIFSTPDNTDGQLVSSFLYDPSYKTITVRMPLELNVGGSRPIDPQDGDTHTPVLSDLIGWDWYPEVRGLGGHLNTAEYTKTESVVGGGFDGFSLNDGQVFTAPDFVFIIFLPQISIVTPQFTYQDQYTGITIVDTDKTMDPSWFRTLIEINTAGMAPKINFLPSASIPDNLLITFTTCTGAQQGATLVADGTDSFITGMGASQNLFLGKGEVVQVIKVGATFHLANQWEGMQRTGIQTDVEIDRVNVIRFNGYGLVVAGVPAPIPRALYPRAEWYVMTQLTNIYTKAARDAGGDDLSGYWAYDATYLYAPDYQGVSRRALPGNRGNDSTRDNTTPAGSYRGDHLKKHRHFLFANEVIHSAGWPDQVSPTDQAPAQFSQNNNTGGASYIMIGVPEDATTGRSSEGGDANETIGKTVGTIAGCYI